MNQRSLFSEIIVDNFAGGGGASTGIELAIGRNVDIAINHDPAAIAMHKTNHPETEHYCESVWDVDPVKACGGRQVALAWFSPDCKHFSKAKGGKPVEKSIRGLAWVAVRWAKLVRPRVIMLENVEEFKTWGPLLGDKPDPKRKGQTFQRFVHALKRYGYQVEWKELRACDYGAPTIRKRFFLIARCDGQPITWPKPTHGNPALLEVQTGRLKPWKTAAEIIDWSIECKSIFERKKPLAENTMKRIARGLKKFVIENPEPFIVSIGQTGFTKDRSRSIHKPLNTVVTKQEACLVVPTLMANQFNNSGGSIKEPVKTILTGNHHYLIAPTIIQYHGEQSLKDVRGQSLEKPLMVVDASPRYALVASFLAKHYGGNYTGAGTDLKDPLHTVTAVDHNALVTSHLIAMYSTSTGSEITQPVPTVTAYGQHIGEVRAFLVKYYGQGEGQPLTEPLHTITSKDRFGLIMIKGHPYQIVDIGMRMLSPRELFNAQGFPVDYIINHDHTGRIYPKTAQVARCGNAVPPPFAEALVKANLPELCGVKSEVS